MSGSRRSGGSERSPRCTRRTRSCFSRACSGLSAAGRERLQHRGIVGAARALLPPLPVVVDGVIAREGHEPGREVAFALAVPVQALVDLDEDLLGEVLRVVHLSDESIRNSEHLAGVERHQLAPRGLIAGSAPRDEVGLGLDHLMPSKRRWQRRRFNKISGLTVARAL